MRWILRMGEILLKSRPVRRFMRKALERHICAQAEIRGARVAVRPWQGLLFLDLIEGEEAAVEDALAHTFGLISVDSLTPVEVDPAKVAAAVIANAPKADGSTFAVQCKRHGAKGKWTSQTFAGAVGAEILALAPHLKVNLGNPEWAVRIALMPEEVGVLGEKIVCQGGLPTGVQGTVLANLQTERDYLASWLAMRRGCRLSFTAESKPELAELVSIWDPYHISAKWKKNLATAPGPGHIGEIWAIVGDNLGARPERGGKIPIATLEPLAGWPEESLEELRQRTELPEAI
ncbi:MAG TPA: THUMP domain-containing protein, partial [Candidatus Thalassarchaeaceae archaeon]|nr:THUMP domain-containing protein [Candidatus Thalassarchaeaceae archaeon]